MQGCITKAGETCVCFVIFPNRIKLLKVDLRQWGETISGGRRTQKEEGGGFRLLKDGIRADALQYINRGMDNTKGPELVEVKPMGIGGLEGAAWMNERGEGWGKLRTSELEEAEVEVRFTMPCADLPPPMLLEGETQVIEDEVQAKDTEVRVGVLEKNKDMLEDYEDNLEEYMSVL
uniref:Uncharacterized protein n=1 Tax=Corethron hystrix TaxID=216773 RepID=A0A7S1BP78_9STRA|mmetsp:Transcript_36080/g.84278  ORF Transcript_36080/g.84278 Transcript_36080/m.84278 type:complete len:176 (+) Transcript_36080:43-570(+)